MWQPEQPDLLLITLAMEVRIASLEMLPRTIARRALE